MLNCSTVKSPPSDGMVNQCGAASAGAPCVARNSARAPWACAPGDCTAAACGSGCDTGEPCAARRTWAAIPRQGGFVALAAANCARFVQLRRNASVWKLLEAETQTHTETQLHTWRTETRRQRHGHKGRASLSRTRVRSAESSTTDDPCSDLGKRL